MSKDGSNRRTGETGYSRFVRLARVFLPLLALVLLSTLFLFARSINPEDAIPFADVDVRELARQGGISAPSFSSRTTEGATLELTASRAVPDASNKNGVTAVGVTAKVDWPDGARLTIKADIGRVDGGSETLELEHNAVIASSLGYAIRSDLLIGRTDIVEIASPESVVGEGPFGDVRAGAMILRGGGKGGNNFVVDFIDGVKWLYDPVR